jgi:hypothetical protein
VTPTSFPLPPCRLSPPHRFPHACLQGQISTLRYSTVLRLNSDADGPYADAALAFGSLPSPADGGGPPVQVLASAARSADTLHLHAYTGEAQDRCLSSYLWRTSILDDDAE